MEWIMSVDQKRMCTIVTLFLMLRKRSPNSLGYFQVFRVASEI